MSQENAYQPSVKKSPWGSGVSVLAGIVIVISIAMIMVSEATTIAFNETFVLTFTFGVLFGLCSAGVLNAWCCLRS